MHIGEAGLGYAVTIDGTPGLVPEDDTRPGRLQIINHRCMPHNNCRVESVLCTDTLWPLFVLVSTRDIPEGIEVTFPYQEPHTVRGVPTIARGAFWQAAASLTDVPIGMHVVLCQCQQVCLNR